MEQQRQNTVDIVRRAPWGMAISLLVIAATFLYNKLYPFGVLVGPVIGIAAFGAHALHLKTQKSWLSRVPGLLLALLGMNAAVAGGILWALPQSLAFACFLYFLLLICFRSLLIKWSQVKQELTKHSNNDAPKDGARFS